MEEDKKESKKVTIKVQLDGSYTIKVPLHVYEGFQITTWVVDNHLSIEVEKTEMDVKILKWSQKMKVWFKDEMKKLEDKHQEE